MTMTTLSVVTIPLSGMTSRKRQKMPISTYRCISILAIKQHGRIEYVHADGHLLLVPAGHRHGHCHSVCCVSLLVIPLGGLVTTLSVAGAALSVVIVIVILIVILYSLEHYVFQNRHRWPT